NLAFGLKLRGHDKATIDKRISEAAQTLGLTEMMDKLPKAMSGGQRQRVALGRALVREPAVFLLDEPLSNLDAKLRHSVRTEIAQLHRKLGTTMIYVTHDQVEAMTLGQRIVVLKDGIIQQIDTPMALYDRPANLFVAGFLGSPAMNVLRGTLQGDAGGVTVVDGAWQAPLGQATIDPAWLQKPIAVGVRPEHLQPAGSEDTHAFTARIEGIEPVGNEIFVNMSSGQHALTMRVAPQALPGVGEDIRVAIHPQGLHFFNPETGERL
ncbi:MAG: ATP-binding cassette domain-containing protein, partial [Stenotrophomonas sp.]